MKGYTIYLVLLIVITIGLLTLLGFLLYSWGITLFWSIMIPILVAITSSIIGIITQFIGNWKE